MKQKSIKKLDTSVIIPITSKKELLLQKKTMDYFFMPGVWALFGGMIESGESPEEAARREIKEELEGLNVDKLKFIFTKDYNGEGLNEIISGKMHVFDCEFDSNLSKLSIKEGAGFALFAPSELKSLNLMPPLKIILEEYLKHKNK